jgi:protein SCO1
MLQPMPISNWNGHIINMNKTTVLVSVLLGGILLIIAAIFVLRQTNPPEIETGTLLEQPKSLPQFEFIDHHGETITRRDLTGQWSLLFTGFTSCPDICPATIHVLNELDKKLRSDDTELRMILLSIDPERDTPEVLAQYLELFSPSLTGITGSLSGIEQFCNEIGMSFIHIPGMKGRYTVEHSGALVLIDPRGRISGYFRPPFDTDRMAGDLQAITEHGGMF